MYYTHNCHGYFHHQKLDHTYVCMTHTLSFIDDFYIFFQTKQLLSFLIQDVLKIMRTCKRQPLKIFVLEIQNVRFCKKFLESLILVSLGAHMNLLLFFFLVSFYYVLAQTIPHGRSQRNTTHHQQQQYLRLRRRWAPKIRSR